MHLKWVFVERTINAKSRNSKAYEQSLRDLFTAADNMLQDARIALKGQGKAVGTEAK